MSIVVLLILANFIISGNKIDFNENGGPMKISPFSEKTELLTKLYFVDQQQLMSETRNIEVDVFQTEIAVLKSLKVGPKITTARAPLASDVEILSVETIDRISYVNLSSEFRAVEHKMLLNVMAIVNTLTEFDNIDQVQILINGNKIGSKEYKLDTPLSRDTSIVHEVELIHKDIVNKFLNYINRGRYDLAYDLVDSQSQLDMAFRDFLERAVVLRESIRGYTLSYIFAEENNDGLLIQVKYKLQDVLNNNQLLVSDRKPTERVFSWSMVHEDSLWRIRFRD